MRVNFQAEGDAHEEFHQQVVPKAEVNARPIKRYGLGLNIVMIMFDSTSAAHFERKMPKSKELLKKELTTVFFKGESVVGDGTTDQVSAMLTGKAEDDHPEARRGKPGAKQVDDWPWVFKDYKKHGYATLFSEDDPPLGAFHYRLTGFRDPPTDHYNRIFWMAIQKARSRYCHGARPVHDMTLRYSESLLKAYPSRPSFSYSLISLLTHDDVNAISYADEDLTQLLRRLDQHSHLNNSIVIIFGDHGFRYSSFRATLQGKLEERLPFLSMTFPKWFPDKYPEVFSNLQHNAKMVTSPFDVHATLKHVLSYPEYPEGITTGQSLFKKIDPSSRTCAKAGIESHWCPCMQWESVPLADPVVQDLAQAVIKHLNDLITNDGDSPRKLCENISLEEVTRISKQMPKDEVQKFKTTRKESHCDSCVPVFGEKAKDTLSKDTMYQLQMVLAPSQGVFETSVRLQRGKFLIDTRYISRINEYGEQPHCIKHTHPHLLKYCYCKVQI